MKKRSFVFALMVLMFPLTGCGGDGGETINPPDKDPVTSFYDVKQTILPVLKEAITKEIDASSRVESNSILNKGDTRIEKMSEVLDIYNDETTFSTGKESVEYPNDIKSNVEDSFSYLINTGSVENQKVIYFVKDYLDGAIISSWKDSATRLPVVKEGEDAQDGVSYLLEKSLPAQLTKQVSLITSNFIDANIINNTESAGMEPAKGKLITYGNNSRLYSLDEYKYEYTQEDSKMTQIYSFNFKLDKDGRLIESNIVNSLNEETEDESYLVKYTQSFKVSYEEKVSSKDKNIIDPLDYFLSEIKDVKAFAYENGEKKYYDLDKIPQQTYLHFEASSYSPTKAVDLTLYAQSSSNEKIAIVDGSEVFETIKEGDVILTVTSATGIVVNIDITIIPPFVESLSYTDSNSGIEYDYDSSTRYIYTGNTYQGIAITVKPSGAYLDDIAFKVDKPSLLEVTQSSKGGNTISYTYKVLGNDETNTVKVTFYSLSNENVSTTITYTIKKGLSDEEILNVMTTNTYRWDNIYTKGIYGLLTFKSATIGHVAYYNEEVLIEETDFTYVREDISLIPTMPSSIKEIYNYNGGEMTYDAKNITLRVDETAYVHHYKIVGK